MRQAWKTTLDGRPLEVEARYAIGSHEVVILVDGFPATREVLPEPIWPYAKVVLHIDGHRLAVIVQLARVGLRFEAALDGICLDTGRPEEELGRREGGSRRVPGRLTFSPSRYYQHFPGWPQASSAALLAGVTMCGWAAFYATQLEGAGHAPATLAAMGVVCIGTALGWLWQDYTRARELFAYGDAVPAKVVSLNPPRIAVAIDLAMPEKGFYPAVRILEQPTLQEPLPPLQLGDRVVAMVRYHDSQNGRWWNDIDAVIAAAGTEDDDAIASLRLGFAPSEWERLDAWTAELTDITEVGLHPLELPRSGFGSSR